MQLGIATTTVACRLPRPISGKAGFRCCHAHRILCNVAMINKHSLNSEYCHYTHLVNLTLFFLSKPLLSKLYSYHESQVLDPVFPNLTTVFVDLGAVFTARRFSAFCALTMPCFNLLTAPSTLSISVWMIFKLCAMTCCHRTISSSRHF